jgi:hypothetical protein
MNPEIYAVFKITGKDKKTIVGVGKVDVLS